MLQFPFRKQKLAFPSVLIMETDMFAMIVSDSDTFSRLIFRRTYMGLNHNVIITLDPLLM